MKLEYMGKYNHTQSSHGSKYNEPKLNTIKVYRKVKPKLKTKESK